ncbi:alpha/beta hydrolase [Burkholderia sp. S171]|uniref:alpha/beta hydrolase n=1 Tax=Burkholderia sp. S171 TaxID=1641860 RepID=UPI00131C1584|nr:alpha/beta hydrolase [Burkholderia sp. S171]
MRLALLFALLCSVAYGLTISHHVSAQAIDAPAKISALIPDTQRPAEHHGSTVLAGYAPDRATGPDKPVRATPAQQFDVAAASGNGTIPVYSTLPLNANAAGIERVVIVVHGESRNAKSNWSSTVDAAKMAAVTGTTLIVGPQFLVPQDIAAQRLPASVLRWKMHDWSRGLPAVSPISVSGFEVLDHLLDHFADRTRYPDLRTVVLVGHSAGAQLVQRYTAVGHGEQALTALGIHTRYVVVEPSSFLYFDNLRPSAAGGFKALDSSACPGATQWRYGLDNAPPYVSGQSAQAVEATYAARDVVYLAGTADNDPDHSELDRSCAGELQGSDRLSRSVSYMKYMRMRHPTNLHQRLVLVPGADHDSKHVLANSCSLPVLFSDSHEFPCASKP